MFVYISWQLEYGKVVACFPVEDEEDCIQTSKPNNSLELLIVFVLTVRI
jgi:hypothetical protein